VIARAALGLAAALVIALVSQRAGSLSRSGALAAVAMGTLSAAAGWDWAVLLLVFFLPASALSRLGAAAKEARTSDIVAKRGSRDWVQVLANGGIFSLAAGLSLLNESPAWMAIGAGAISAAAADTWGTEIGTLAGGEPRRIDTLRRVPAGTSGAVSGLGLAATVLGAALIAGAVWALDWPRWVLFAAFAGGVAGALADSVLGATLQARRRCPVCDRATEREVHGCGERTVPAGGVRWMDNDVVNVLATLTGAVVAALFVA
jgi:uncharacterized protein (TIGR00297 family)